MMTFLPRLEFKFKHIRLNHHNLEKGVLFSLSRHVISSIIAENDWCENHQILMPGSLCEDAFKPFLRAGLTIKCYGLNKSLASDLTSIRNNIQFNTVAIYMVHYFGRRDPNIDAIRNLCDKLGIVLIEDCALCSPDDVYSGIGSYGDYSFFSLWKYLPIPDGSIAYSRGRAKVLQVPTQRADFSRVAKRLFKLMMPGNLGKKLRVKIRQDHSIQSTHNYLQLIKNESPPQSISFVSKLIIRFVDFDSVSNLRRDHYRFLVKSLENHPSITTLWCELDPDVIPYCLPLITSKPTHLQEFLLQRGIESELSVNDYYPWPGKVEGNIQEMEYIRQLARSVLSIPVHQALSEREIIKISSSLSAYE